MFVDFVALQLIDLVMGLVLLAVYVLFYLVRKSRRMAPGFLATGSLGAIAGFYEIFTWPLPGSYNIAFGELSVLFGFVLFFAGLALARKWDLLSVVMMGALAGIAAIVVGIRVLDLGMTQSPILAGIGYLATGLSALLLLVVYFYRKLFVLRVIVACIILIAALVWAITGYGAYWDHLDAFGKWIPATMHGAAGN